MKVETFLLKAVFAASVFACLLTLGAMVTTTTVIGMPALVATNR